MDARPHAQRHGAVGQRRLLQVDYGADPTGAKDSTQAIQKAISDGKRCGAACNGATTKNAIVYFPPGKYLVSSSISVYFGTQVIGDANDWPTIVAASSYVGLGVLSTDVYVENGGTGPDGNALEWYINTARFYSQIRNLRLDITRTDPGAYVAALHYQVAQATTIENVEIIADSGTTQQGIYAENGSGGVMSDITFTGGNFGIYGGAQQFSATRLTFNGCNTAVQMIWNWGWVWKSITVNNAQVGFRLYNDGNGAIPGSVTIVDSTFNNIRESSIEMAVPVDVRDSGFTGLVLDNVQLGAKIKDHWSTNSILAAGYYKNDNKRTWTNGPKDYTRETTLQGPTVAGLQVAPYFERKRNQYADKSAADFVHLKDEGAKGDGSTDDTAAVQNAFNKYGDGSKIIFVDAGTYILKGTVTIPKDAKIVGETWSQFAANGAKFSDASNPVMQDLILTSMGPTPGVVLMEWNVQAKSAGAAALWDVHVRLGGATGTQLTPTECPPITTGTNPSKCQVASMLLHLWVADHMIDDPLLTDPLNNMDQLSVYSARGMLIESRKATWLYGTASEHSVMYQYNFNGARNIYTTFLQTESPYYQPTPKPPAPFQGVVGKFAGDPDYSCKDGDADGCDESWAVIMKKCQNIQMASAGTYSWFSTYSQDCIDTHTCQKSLWLLDSNYDDNRLQNIIGIGAKNIIANLAVTSHPAWAHISQYDVPSVSAAPVDNECTIPLGEIEVWSLDGQVLNHAEDTDGTQYVTIVNLTPYKMVHTGGPEPYQFAAWDFGDIPSGKARKNVAIYDTSLTVGSFVDTNGYANYKLEGTDKTFQVHVTTHIPDSYERRVIFDLGGMGMGWRELGFPGERVSVALVITGSEQYGYVNSLMYNVIKDRQLRHVVVPGAHDAGMSKISDSGWFGAGTASTTETQSLDHYNQLRVGVRYFDMRIVSVNGGDFWSAHVTDEKAAGPAGATGESLNELIAGINSFTTDYPGEVIVWSIRDQRYWDATKATEFYTQLERINNRCPPGLASDPTVDKLPIKTFMDANNGKGCVLLLTDDGNLKQGIIKDRPSSGIYRLHDYLSLDDFWAEEQGTRGNAPKVVARLHTHKRDNTTAADTYFIMQRQCTPFTGDLWDPPTLQLIANQETNPALYHYGVNSMSPHYFPSVILHDAAGLFHISDLSEQGYSPMMQTLAIGLNLYMVSQNCKVSTGKNPLLVSKTQAKVSSARGGGFQTFRGVIFANGTVLDEAPVGFCRTCTFNDTTTIDHPPVLNGTSRRRRREPLKPVAVW
ncbi:pectate lyase superfamily protein-domain-containing protein [Chaetomium tenue]|uniref:Pectate lyase superfamily protein-domain-containing protein n=1 Tax=Chaetomium tenue TaxID=1854479 RepID=A0ACB7P480_9PEZI|nr:pectate lyase superfamily protein-domain-containing protein [Chaetomium globosum]